MKYILFFLSIVIIVSFSTDVVSAQSVGINSDGSKPNANAMLDVKAFNKGILIPRTSTASRTAIPNTKGLLVYDTTTSSFWYNDGSAWKTISGGSSHWTTSGSSIYYNTGNVGIGTSTPTARLQVIDSSVVFSATGIASTQPGNPPVSGAGRRMMWYADKAAFRVGYASSNEWDAVNIGKYSFASGALVTASGDFSTALGDNTIASGLISMGVGNGASAIGNYSTAIGTACRANAISSAALGYHSFTSGDYSAAFGNFIQATGNYSVALGSNGAADGYQSITLSNNFAFASGPYSTAMGSYVKTNGMSGAFIIGDDGSGRSNSTYYSDVANQMQMVFAGGYRLYTGSSASGVYMNGGDNSWSQISDSTKKEKILPVDGEELLGKISTFKLGTWNYKGQDPKIFRHYGPMAQDFHNAFGHDALGTIGNDTLINQADFLGVSFTAIQALEKRTEKIEQQQQQISALQKQNETLLADNQKLQQQLQLLLSTVSTLGKKVQELATVQSSSNTIVKK